MVIWHLKQIGKVKKPDKAVPHKMTKNLKKFWLVHESHTYQASSPFQFASNAVKRSMLSSLPASHVVLRGSALMIISLGHCHFQWSATVLLILKALIPFAKVLEPPLHCMFVSSSWAKCIVDVVSSLQCFTTHFELEMENHSDLLFV